MKRKEEEVNWSIQDAKDGDVIACDSGWTCIFKRIHGIWFSSYCVITDDGEFYMGYEEHEVGTTRHGNAHLANEEEKHKIFQAVKNNGYKWNAETKSLETIE